MMATGSHHSTPLATRATMAPRTRNLSARGSRKAPERVAPWRRASQPSKRSLVARTIHSHSAGHSEPSSRMSTTSNGSTRIRTNVTALAGVAKADGPKVFVVAMGGAGALRRFQVGARGAGDGHLGEPAHRQVLRYR